MGMFGKSKNAESMLKEYRDKIEDNKKQIDALKLKLKSIPKDN
jgi:ABC-type Fe3+-hydroxamate transport system substrate-binding protein